jgi:hypothetical protein
MHYAGGCRLSLSVLTNEELLAVPKRSRKTIHRLTVLIKVFSGRARIERRVSESVMKYTLTMSILLDGGVRRLKEGGRLLRGM